MANEEARRGKLESEGRDPLGAKRLAAYLSTAWRVCGSRQAEIREA